MKLQTVSIFVDDQQQALDFYTGTLGFEITADVPLGADVPHVARGLSR